MSKVENGNGVDLRKLLPRGYAKEAARLYPVGKELAYKIAQGVNHNHSEVRLWMLKLAKEEKERRDKINDLENSIKSN